MAYTTINKSTEHFNTKLYTGDAASSLAITGVGFQPDLTWFKKRSATYSHMEFDAVRGVGKSLEPDTTAAQGNQSNGLTSFDTDGFTIGDFSAGNNNGATYASWNWKAGTSFTNSAGANGANLATTAGSVNTDAGFSILKWNSSGMAGEGLLAHGLGVVPSVIMIKSTSASDDWYTYHKSLGATKYVRLNQTAAETSSTWLENKTPTATLISLDNTFWGTQSVDYIAYCFAEKQGYSKFGSYTGNGNADGTFVYTGFKPAFVMVKRTDSANNWTMYDNKRPNSFNEITHTLIANASDAEATSTSDDDCDFLSNGVKMRCTNNGSNGSGASYIYMAFAEAPLVGTNNVPCTAR